MLKPSALVVIAACAFALACLIQSARSADLSPVACAAVAAPRVGNGR